MFANIERYQQKGAAKMIRKLHSVIPNINTKDVGDINLEIYEGGLVFTRILAF